MFIQPKLPSSREATERPMLMASWPMIASSG